MNHRAWLLLLLLLLLGLLAVAPSAHAQSASAIFDGPQNMDAGLQSGMNNLTGYVYFCYFMLACSKPKGSDYPRVVRHFGISFGNIDLTGSRRRGIKVIPCRS